MRSREEAEKEVQKINMATMAHTMALHYDEAVGIAMRGWPAWRIAQYYELPADIIHKLGGPAAKQAL